MIKLEQKSFNSMKSKTTKNAFENLYYFSFLIYRSHDFWGNIRDSQ